MEIRPFQIGASGSARALRDLQLKYERLMACTCGNGGLPHRCQIREGVNPFAKPSNFR